MENRNFYGSVKAALAGLRETLWHERNFRAMIVIACMVIVAMLYFPTSRAEKAALFTTIFSVLILELVNVVIERLLDFLEQGYNDKIRIIKDMMAAIVLLASIGATTIGFIIFLPYIGW